MRPAHRRGSTRHEYSVRLARLGRGVETSEQGQPRIHRVRHDMRRPADAPQLQREQRAEGMAGRDHGASRHAAVPDDGRLGRGAPGPGRTGTVRRIRFGTAGATGRAWWRRRPERPAGGPPRAGSRAGAAAVSKTRPAAGSAARWSPRPQSFIGKPSADVGCREVRLPSQLDHSLVPLPGFRGFPPGLRTGAAADEEECCIRVLPKLGTEIAEGAVAVSEAPCGFCSADPVDE